MTQSQQKGVVDDWTLKCIGTMKRAVWIYIYRGLLPLTTFVIMIRKQNLLAFSLAPLMGFGLVFLRLERNLRFA